MKTKLLTQKRSCNGQSIVEYMILIAVVIALLLVFLAPGGYFEQVFNRTIQKQGDDMLNAAATIFN